jgi:hypothetical protein
MATKKVRQQKFFPLLFIVVVGSRMGKNQDPGKTSRIRNTAKMVAKIIKNAISVNFRRRGGKAEKIRYRFLVKLTICAD